LEKTKEKINEKKIKIRKVEKKSNFEKKRKKKRSGEESLWINVVIHNEMCVGEQLKKIKKYNFKK
jgi:hypothetical protein